MPRRSTEPIPFAHTQKIRFFGRSPLPIEAVAWLLFLPITLGLWIWQRGWAAPIRLILLITLAAWNLFLFFPRR